MNELVKPPRRLIFHCRFGSHLYGTATPESDRDEKGVFAESLDNIVLGRSARTISASSGDNGSRNTRDDFDFEFKEMRTFLSEAMAGQTYAMDMLFCNEENIIFASDEWRFIQQHRDKIVSKNVKPFIGYCRQQAGKYGLKGSRLGALESVIAQLEAMNSRDDLTSKQIQESEFIKYHNDGKVDYIEVLGKKFQLRSHVENTLRSLKIMHEKYGQRSRMAQQNDGIDWKAVSHAYRCMFEVAELLQTGGITFPLRHAAFIMIVKAGMIDWNKVNEDLPGMMEQIEMIARNSNLPDEPDRKFWDEFVLESYLQTARG